MSNNVFNVKRKSKITKSIEEFPKGYKEKALEKSNGVKQTKMTTFFTIVEQNAEKKLVLLIKNSVNHH